MGVAVIVLGLAQLSVSALKLGLEWRLPPFVLLICGVAMVGLGASLLVHRPATGTPGAIPHHP